MTHRLTVDAGTCRSTSYSRIIFRGSKVKSWPGCNAGQESGHLGCSSVSGWAWYSRVQRSSFGFRWL